MKRPLFAIGTTPDATIAIGLAPRGLLAIGVLPHGFVSIGVVSRGVVSVGLVALGSFAALGLAAVAPIADAVLFTLAAVAYTHRYGDDVLHRPRLAAANFVGTPLVTTLLILLVAFAARHLLLRRRKTLAAGLARLADAPARATEDLVVDDVEIEGATVWLSSGGARVSATVSHAVREGARAVGRHVAQIVRLRRDELELHDDEAVDFRHAPVAQVTYTALELREPEDQSKLALANLHLLAAGVALTATLAATIAYLATAH